MPKHTSYVASSLKTDSIDWPSSCEGVQLRFNTTPDISDLMQVRPPMMLHTTESAFPGRPVSHSCTLAGLFCAVYIGDEYAHSDWN